jgi:NTE family protein
MGVGTRWEFLNLNPRFSDEQEIRGNGNQLYSYFYAGMNSLDRRIYPRKGIDLNFETGWIYNEHPGFRIFNDGVQEPVDSTGITFKDYQRYLFQMKYYIPFGMKGALQVQAGSGVNFNHRQGPINAFLIGGLNEVLHNQLPFVGILEGEVSTSSAATFQLAYNYEVAKNIFATPRVGAAVYDFMGAVSTKYKYLSGYGLSGGYSTFMGPIEGTMMYCDQDGRLRFYVNIGFNF